MRARSQESVWQSTQSKMANLSFLLVVMASILPSVSCLEQTGNHIASQGIKHDWVTEHAELKKGGNFNHRWISVASMNESQQYDFSRQNLDRLYPTLEDRASTSGRFLWEEYTNDDLKSNFCKTKCIDEEKVFCSNTALTSGKCYEPQETPVRENYCSSDNPSSPKMFKLFLCPNEAACESK